MKTATNPFLIVLGANIVFNHPPRLRVLLSLLYWEDCDVVSNEDKFGSEAAFFPLVPCLTRCMARLMDANNPVVSCVMNK